MLRWVWNKLRFPVESRTTEPWLWSTYYRWFLSNVVVGRPLRSLVSPKGQKEIIRSGIASRFIFVPRTCGSSDKAVRKNELLLDDDLLLYLCLSFFSSGVSLKLEIPSLQSQGQNRTFAIYRSKWTLANLWIYILRNANMQLFLHAYIKRRHCELI